MRPDLDSLLEGTGLEGQRESIIRAALVAASPEAFDCESQRRFLGVEAEPTDPLVEVVAYLRQRAQAHMEQSKTGRGLGSWSQAQRDAALESCRVAAAVLVNVADVIEAGKHRQTEQPTQKEK